MRDNGMSQTEIAEILGVGRTTLYRHLKETPRVISRIRRLLARPTPQMWRRRGVVARTPLRLRSFRCPGAPYPFQLRVVVYAKAT